MNDDKITELFIKLNSELASLNTNMKTVLDKLTNHEQRLMNLETKKESDWKTQLLMLLAKAIVIGAVSIGSLVGAGSIIRSVLGVFTKTKNTIDTWVGRLQKILDCLKSILSKLDDNKLDSQEIDDSVAEIEKVVKAW